jgi:IclR family pca regulon transcriptional regulator
VSRADPDYLDSVEKALRVLQLFSAEHPTLTVSQVAQAGQVSRPTARRILLTLVRLGFADADGSDYRLTPRVLRLGYAYLSSQPFWSHIDRPIRELSNALNESCSVATLDGAEIVYVVRSPAQRTISLTLSIGSRLPAFATSMGRVLLAALAPDKLDAFLATGPFPALTPHTVTDVSGLRAAIDEARTRGYAVVDEEREEGVRSAAVPIHGEDGETVAALNVSVNSGRIDLRRLTDVFVPELLETARRIDEAIASLPAPRSIG